MNDWTPSKGNAFDWDTKEPTVFSKDPTFTQYAKLAQKQTELVEKKREQGDNMAIYGISNKADLMIALFKKKGKK